MLFFLRLALVTALLFLSLQLIVLATIPGLQPSTRDLRLPASFIERASSRKPKPAIKCCSRPTRSWCLRKLGCLRQCYGSRRLMNHWTP